MIMQSYIYIGKQKITWEGTDGYKENLEAPSHSAQILFIGMPL